MDVTAQAGYKRLVINVDDAGHLTWTYEKVEGGEADLKGTFEHPHGHVMYQWLGSNPPSVLILGTPSAK